MLTIDVIMALSRYAATAPTEQLAKYWTGRKSTCESKRTMAGKSIHLILTRSIMLTWISGTFVDVRLTTSTCKRNGRIGELVKRDNYMQIVTKTSTIRFK